MTQLSGNVLIDLCDNSELYMFVTGLSEIKYLQGEKKTTGKMLLAQMTLV